MRKRALWIAGLLLAAAVASCGEAAPAEPASTDPVSREEPSSETESSSDPEPETEAQSEDGDWKSSVVYTVYPEPDIPADLDLSGKTFRMSATGWVERFIVESLNGEIINDTIYNRNLQMEDHFGVKFEVIDTGIDTTGNLNAIVSSGLQEFDMVYCCGDSVTGLITRGFCLDFCSLPFIDFTDGYWFPDLVEQFSCFGKVFLAPSDLSVDMLGAMVVTFFNKRILSENDLENPYQMVYDNTWTLDNFLAMVRQVSGDLNGDGVMDEHDLYGIGVYDGDIDGAFITLAFGSNMKITAPNPDGSLSFAMEGEKLQSIIDRSAPVLKDRTVAFDLREHERVTGERSGLFPQGQLLFEMTFMRRIQEDFREMEDDYGILPVPKYDEAQENYHHRACCLGNFFCVPATAPDLEKTGAVFSYLSWLSNQTYLPAYYEVTLKQKRTRDEDSAKMLDLIRRTTYYDFGDVWTNVRNYIAMSFEAGSYERVVAANMKKWNKELKKIQDKLRDLE
ncbi:MAG: hypothetical protein II719_00695 [Clostridia bacterium]|nr:hypothetical protein [Clostridia bacterium]